MKETESTGPNGRDHATGQFSKGNKVGRGNPHAARVQKLRTALYRAVTPDDLTEVIQAMLKAAKSGEIAAARELLSRLLGPPEAADLIARVEQLERQLAELRTAGVVN